jgi:hypothetical protein
MRGTVFIEAISMNDDVEVLHEFEPLLRSAIRERFDILFVCVTLFIGWIVFDLMANTILVKVVFGHGIFFHFSGSQKLMGALLKILKLLVLLIASFIFIQTVE